ncbi:UDP-3-O-(3-hydroxymyristoyl)glucosamine N-acyltransferase [Pontibacter sp. G13]|uniref:UDP-3-O-(3-hydroxymyristoyl)glucosamine N-acyltransferase n=1 Tax=Pontibacter sp. G13 TaxID=3074898 RepID=UPI00288AEDC0|nr:UDP-3-O-(3-hydroxymyristoyl)glucosamine N-acyltransferase [Pontibacter sp. G13]WNJ17663.1 UDP-3-O-(3-hydroxymyristoyl)glucosamine N-acyltransferase [Pontibacter sp. G13]
MKFHTPQTLQSLAELLNCTFVGDPQHPVTGINEIHMVEQGDLTFVDIPKYFNKALHSAATTILINQAVEPPFGKGLLVVEEPFSAFNQLTEHFKPTYALDKAGEPEQGEGVRIGRNVVFGTEVIIGAETEIGHNVVIGNHVQLGSHCRIHANVTIEDHTVIGDHVTINAGTVIGGEAFYFKNRPIGREKMLAKGRVVIEDHVDIGANCTIDRGVTGDTRVGAWTKLDNLVQIGHDTQVGKKCLIASQVGIAGVVTVEDEVILWGQVGVSKDLVIGKGAELLGKTGVMSSLEGGKRYLGMIAVEASKKLREIAMLRKLPELYQGMSKKQPRSVNQNS